jgi:hypothetical protein
VNALYDLSTSGSNGPVVVSTDLEWRRRRRYLPLPKVDMWCSVTFQFKSIEYTYNTDLHCNLNRSVMLASLNVVLFGLIVVNICFDCSECLFDLVNIWFDCSEYFFGCSECL